MTSRAELVSTILDHSYNFGPMRLNDVQLGPERQKGHHLVALAILGALDEHYRDEGDAVTRLFARIRTEIEEASGRPDARHVGTPAEGAATTDGTAVDAPGGPPAPPSRAEAPQEQAAKPKLRCDDCAYTAADSIKGINAMTAHVQGAHQRTQARGRELIPR